MVPYARAPYREGGDNISRLLMEQGRLRADSAQRSGDIWGQTVQSLGQQAGGAMEAHQMAKRDAALDAALKTWDGKDPRALFDSLKMLDPMSRAKVTEGMVGIMRLGQKDEAQERENWALAVKGAAALPYPVFAANWATIKERLGPGAQKYVGVGELPEQADEQTYNMARQLAQQFGGAKAPEGFTLGKNEKRFGPAGEVLAENMVPDEAKPPNLQHIETAEGIRTFNPQTGQLGPVMAKGKPPASESNPAKFWVIRNGKALRVSEAEYQPGDLPANTREQGRPVVSGDAGRIADLDTSLDDLGTLEKTLTETKGATGTQAKAGAMLPNAITELTGWGEDAKKRQAVIDRVKQVIGKALEGGVLRKEDEYKYKAILPTIGDTQAVAQSKLNGLRDALTKRRETTLDALDDAGYDVAKYRARKGAAATQPGTVGRFKVEVE
jgi:hypothetical protein